jgi:hypothetical protein
LTLLLLFTDRPLREVVISGCGDTEAAAAAERARSGGVVAEVVVAVVVAVVAVVMVPVVEVPRRSWARGDGCPC